MQCCSCRCSECHQVLEQPSMVVRVPGLHAAHHRIYKSMILLIVSSSMTQHQELCCRLAYCHGSSSVFLCLPPPEQNLSCNAISSFLSSYDCRLQWRRYAKVLIQHVSLSVCLKSSSEAEDTAPFWDLPLSEGAFLCMVCFCSRLEKVPFCFGLRCVSCFS